MDIGQMNILGQMTHLGQINMELFNEKINEFVNWQTCRNELTGVSLSGEDMPASGGSIRGVIQDHMKVPFVTYEDSEDNKIYFFSSEDAKQLWKSHRYEDNNETYTDLILFSMTKPSDYTIDINNEFTSVSRYIIAGDSDQDATKMIYTWDVKLGDRSEVDNLLVSYKITCPSGKTYQVAETKAYQDRLNTSNPLNLYPYLENGENTVNIRFKAQNTGAEKNLQIPITVLQFNIQSSFQYYNRVEVGDSFTVPVVLDRNITSQSANIYVNIDGQMAAINNQSAGLPFTVQPGVTGTVYLNINNAEDQETGLRPYRGSTSSEDITHVMQIWAETTYSNITFKSNLLYYTFEIKSESVLSNKFINVGINYSTAAVNTYPIGSLVLYGTQYNKITVPWGYYTDSISYDTAVTIDWKLYHGNDVTTVASLKGETGTKPSDLVFIPNIWSINGDVYLKAYCGEDLLLTVPMIIYQGSSNVVAPSGMALSLSAYSKNNNTEDKSEWYTTGTSIPVQLSNEIKYNSTSGWNNHALRISGITEYATIAYNVFDESTYSINNNGRTIEFEFESEKVNDDDDIIMIIGKPNESRIEVTPNSATLYDNSNNMVIKTNFKNNEKVKLCFIFNPVSNTVDNQLIYIVSNGILERASVGGASFGVTSGANIKIGGALSGIKFYNLRVYNYAISYNDAYNNYVYDSEDKGSIIANNNVIKNGVIDYDLCCAKIDTILIEGNLDALLSGSTDKDQSTTNAKITRSCPYDSTKNFTVTDAQIRKHGQSTLSYPITSMKFWLNKKFSPNNENDVPRFTCEGQSDLGLAKNRYKMKDTSIPANKFILQANYADSSGVHNGGLERLINDTWFKAVVDNKYVLRTEPQLVSSIGSNEKNLYGIDKVWHDYINNDFPYQIRISPDSFPCVVFYKNGEGEITYLGQYVFMEDKKSDFNYGERSIYRADPADPFCLKTINKKSDTAANKIWDNGNVLRIEVLDINDPFTSYMSWTKDGEDFDQDIPEKIEETVDPNTGEVIQSVIPRHFNWEGSFEMIYPDPDDIEEDDSESGLTKFSANSKFRTKVQPFLNWVRWLTDCRNNYNNTTDWWQAGTYNTAQEAFNATAADHLDLYKMAAYYIFMLRFGLTDSGERNVQIKTYDGVHFHYEPWDMDIAMGNRNDGGIAFNPPVDRNTRLGNGYAISGRSASTSNFLWDSLEGYSYWANDIVRDVSKALFTAGLTYDNCTEIFDENYANKWSEVLYNRSGYYKYITRGGGAQIYLNWLQGARMLHRHWWLSSSMNYYDAKWGVGAFNDSRIDLFAGHQRTENSEEFVNIYPTSSTFFKMEVNQTTSLGTQSATRQSPARFNIGPITFQAKTPTYIYGANFIEKLDLSVIAPTLARISLGGSYDKVLGAPIKELNVGVPVTQIDADTYTGTLNIADPGNIETTVGEGENKIYALTNLQTLNIRGQLGQGSETGNFYTTFTMLRDLIDERGDLSQVKNLYAMGSGIVNFVSSNQGNQFENLELPDAIYSLNLNNTSWQNLSFWTTTANGSDATFTRYKINNDSDLFVPSTINELVLNGTTGHSLNSKNLVLTWINGIIAQLGVNPTDEQIEEALSSKTLRMNDIKWDSTTCNGDLLTYEELSLIAKIGTLDLKGYIILHSDPQSPLQSEQLTQLTQWFGNDIFTYSSSGLIVDYALDTTIISVSGDITLDEFQNIHLKEGHTAILNATKFHLNNEASNVTWTIRERVLDANNQPIETYAGDVVRSCSLDTSNPRQILLKAANSTNSAYSIFVHSSLGNAEIVVYIDPTDYPTLEIQNTENIARISGDDIVLYQSNVNDNFRVVTVSAAAEAVSIQGIAWGIKINGTNVPIDLITDPNQYKTVNNSTILQYKKGSNRQDIRLLASIPPSDESIYEYTLTAEVNLGGKVEILNKTIIVMNDSSIITSAGGSNAYLVLNNLYTSLYGHSAEVFYRSTLMNLTGTLDFSVYPTTSMIIGSTNKSLLYYLENITGLDMTGCTLMQDTYVKDGVTINQIDFSNMHSLQTLSIQGCSGLQNDIDLSNNSNIVSVDASGTNINVILPTNPAVTTYKLGTPTEISIVNPTSLQPTSFTIDDGSVIESVDIKNIPNNLSYTVFGKLLGNSGLPAIQHLRIEQSNIEEIVSMSVISNLSSISKTTLDNTSDLYGRLNAQKAYIDDVEYLNSKYSTKLYITAMLHYIRFENSTIENICSTSWGDSDGLSTERAATVSTITNTSGTAFSTSGITDISWLQYFTSATTLSSNLFTDCTGITQLVFPPNLTRIEEGNYNGNPDAGGMMGCFLRCSGLTEIIIPEGVTFIGAAAFCWCNNVEVVDVASTVTSIRKQAFNVHSGLTKSKYMIFRGTTPPGLDGDNSIGNRINANHGFIFVPDSAVTDYQTAGGNWSAYSSYIKPLSDLPNYIVQYGW